jgi:hypothetical protein
VVEPDAGGVAMTTLVKIHILVTVLATQFISLFVERGLPYFPIEISRSAANDML